MIIRPEEHDCPGDEDQIAEEGDPGGGFGAALAETAAVNVETADDGRGDGHGEDQVHEENESGAGPDPVTDNEEQTTKDLHPGKGGGDEVVAEGGKEFVRGDVAGEGGRVGYLEPAGVEENPAQDVTQGQGQILSGDVRHGFVPSTG